MNPIDLLACGHESALLHRVAELLAAHWDPNGEFAAPPVFLNAAGSSVNPDDRRAPTAHAEVILAMYAAGGPQADVVGYFRRAEEEALGCARTNAGERWALAALIWRWSYGHEPMLANGRDVAPFAPRADQDCDAAP